jgi:hypothetical protein
MRLRYCILIFKAEEAIRTFFSRINPVHKVRDEGGIGRKYQMPGFLGRLF